jgi:hypothetical protein
MWDVQASMILIGFNSLQLNGGHGEQQEGGGGLQDAVLRASRTEESREKEVRQE